MMSIKDKRNGENMTPPKIIIADDKYINIELLHMRLQSVGLDQFCVFCQDGQVVVDEIKKIVNEALLKAKYFPVTPIAILILDVNMPIKSGPEALKDILQFYDSIVVPEGMIKNNFVKLPHIIMMSSQFQTKFKETSSESRHDEFFTSPLGKVEVARIIQLYNIFTTK